MEVIILAGGRGTRLHGVIDNLPKPMAPVNGKPFLFYIFDWLKDYPVSKIILSTGYKAELIEDYFGKSFSNIEIQYVVEKTPLGTGGAIKYSLNNITGDNFLILNGDTYFPIDIDRFLSFHLSNNYKFSVALKHLKNFDRFGAIECIGDEIVKFKEKKFCADGLINGGIYLVNREYFESRHLPEIFSLEKDLMEKETGSSLLKGLIFGDEFIDIGMPEDYLRASAILKP